MNFNEVSVEQDDHMDYENNEITTTSAPDNDFVQNNDNEINESTSTVDEITTEKINDEMVELLEPYLTMEDYNMTTAKRVCGDVSGLLCWTKAMAFFFGELDSDFCSGRVSVQTSAMRLCDFSIRLNFTKASLTLCKCFQSRHAYT